MAGVTRTPSAALSRKESYKAQRQHYRREKKRAATALLHSIEDPSVVVLADWLKVTPPRSSLVESYKAQRLSYCKEKKSAATALLDYIEDPSVLVLADWLKVSDLTRDWFKIMPSRF